MLNGKRESASFTLIELLVVVAIISILAAIAVPNFLEAQKRSKVSRVKNDQRTLTTALEAYRVDANTFPVFAIPPFFSPPVGMEYRTCGLTMLTTPISYVTSLPKDPFYMHRGWVTEGGGSRHWDLTGGSVDNYYGFGYVPACASYLPTGNGAVFNWYPPPPPPPPPFAFFLPWEWGRPKDMYVLSSVGPDMKGDHMAAFPNLFGVLPIRPPPYHIVPYHFRTDGYSPLHIYDASNGTISEGDIIRWECPAQYNVVLEIGYDAFNGIDPTAGEYDRWRQPPTPPGSLSPASPQGSR